MYSISFCYHNSNFLWEGSYRSKLYALQYAIRQVGRGGVDRASSSDSRGSGFATRPLHFKKYHFFTPKPKGSLRSRAHPRARISEAGHAEKIWLYRGRGQILANFGVILYGWPLGHILGFHLFLDRLKFRWLLFASLLRNLNSLFVCPLPHKNATFPNLYEAVYIFHFNALQGACSNGSRN